MEIEKAIQPRRCGNCGNFGVHAEQASCLEGPPTVTYFLLGAQKGQPIIHAHCGYPPVALDWPACSRWKVQLLRPGA